MDPVLWASFATAGYLVLLFEETDRPTDLLLPVKQSYNSSTSTRRAKDDYKKDYIYIYYDLLTVENRFPLLGVICSGYRKHTINCRRGL